MKLNDSGQRREFSTGAARDIADGKGRCDLLPLEVLGERLNVKELVFIELFIRKGSITPLYYALDVFANRAYNGDLWTMILEVSKHYEDGAQKYSPRNWEKGIPLHCYIDSGVRHLLKYFRGDKDEPHDRAFVWNMLGAIWTLRNLPEQNDLPFSETKS